MKKYIFILCFTLLCGGCSYLSKESNLQKGEVTASEETSDSTDEKVEVTGTVVKISEAGLDLQLSDDPTKIITVDLFSSLFKSTLELGDTVTVEGAKFGSGISFGKIKNVVSADNKGSDSNSTSTMEENTNGEQNEQSSTEEQVEVEEPIQENKVTEEDPLDGLSFSNFKLELLSKGSADNPVASYKLYFSVQNNSDTIQYIDDDSFVIKKNGDVLKLDYTDSFKVFPDQNLDYHFWFYKRTDSEDRTYSISGYTLYFVNHGKLYPIQNLD